MRAALRSSRCSRMRRRRSVIADRHRERARRHRERLPGRRDPLGGPALPRRLSQERPLLVVIEDAHWAEPTFVDLIEHVVAADGRGRCSCSASCGPSSSRTIRTGRPSRSPSRRLSPEESGELLALLAPELAGGEGDRDQIVATASGNPLFLEQLAAFAAERRAPTAAACLLPTCGRSSRPGSTGSARVSARSSKRAAVVGREFWAGAVADLLPPQGRATLARHLEALARKGLTEADASPAPFEQAFRFRHVLIQEAAYRSLPKGRRAELHERVAGWLERSPLGLSVDADQVIGYHLEQAYRYRAELGPVDDGLRSLGERAGDRLEAAGRRALEREDAPAAVNLLERALTLLADQPAGPALSVRLAEALDLAGRARTAVLASGEGRRRGQEVGRPSNRMAGRNTTRSAWAPGLRRSSGPTSESQKPPPGLSRSFRRWTMIWVSPAHGC